MTRLLPLALVLGVVIYALVDCIQTPAAQARAMRKPLWLAVIVLLPLVGAIAWFVAGRPRRTPKAPLPPRPLAPDDDPDFLRQLRLIDDEHERMLREWERDLRRREGEVPPGSRSDGDSRADGDKPGDDDQPTPA